MDIAFWGALILVFFVGAGASFISQYATAGKGVEASAKAEALKQNLQHLRERNAKRRETLDNRQGILDEYRLREIEGRDVVNGDALQRAIELEVTRTDGLRQTILDSERIITEYDNALGNLAVQRAKSAGLLLVASTVIGGFTSLLFGGINYLASGTNITSITASVTITSSVIVQSLSLGAGWPLVWEKFLASDKLEAAANSAAARFETSVMAAERAEV